MSLDVDLRARFTAPGAEPFVVDAALAADAGETLVVLGPSGSGKTLLLEAVAGFHPCEGRVVAGGRDVSDLAPERREFGFVFQDYALFPHLTVAENVRFGERYHDVDVDADALLDSLGVAELAARYPPTLSGGERQRVALARSLAVDPDVFLLDEPLSALDAPTRTSLRADLAETLAGRTALYVTHDRTTARALADRVAVMRDGSVVQSGAPDDVFERPASPYVARFTGANVLSLGGEGGDAVAAAIRPEHVGLVEPGRGDREGVVERVVREDAAFRVTVALDADGAEGSAATTAAHAATDGREDATLDAFAADPPAPGDRVGLALPADRLTRFDGA